jgi:two-component system, NtrC family, response regulator AtoC
MKKVGGWATLKRIMPNLLFIDHDELLCKDVCSYLQSAGMQIHYALDSAAALEIIRANHLDLIISHVQIFGSSIKELIDAAREKDTTTVVLVHTEIDSVNEAARAVKAGAYGILRKPFNIPELSFHIKKALEKRSQNLSALNEKKQFSNIYQPSSFIGQCPQIKQVFTIVTKVAKSRSSVIITGETGTGKELIAGSIHYNSDRSQKPFVRVNCAALPESLLESELFGYERGAFTGADKTRIGRFEQADGGSIFLDEVADMSLYTQAKVLRVLQEKEFERVGSNQTVKTDVRIISATNKDLLSLIEKGEFREDLYYRLNVINIHLPPLRERGEDIRLLVHFFVRKYSPTANRRIRGVHREAMKMLTDYHWPGNIRELENTIERAVLMTQGDIITPEELRLHFLRRPRTVTQDAPGSFSLEIPPEGVRLEEVEEGLILKALEQTNWVQKDAAALLNISSRVLNYKIKRFGITHENWRQNK